MDVKSILAKCDHTLLGQTATFDDIKKLCDQAIKYQTASVCIPPCYVKAAKEYTCGKLAICTVIGFPNGYNTTAVKCFEAKEAVENGAEEIDMVINLGDLKEGNYQKILEEINLVKRSCKGKVLKVIVETCLLSDEEKVKICETVSNSNADFIKTSTGFSKGGATLCDIELFKNNIKNGKKIKAAGGIKSLSDAENFLKIGADRLGTSKIVKAVKEMEK